MRHINQPQKPSQASAQKGTATRPGKGAAKTKPAAPTKAPKTRASRNPLVVGIGASAGGLEALEEFFKHMPIDTGMAFVVTTHQHPGHVSLLPELLRKCTRMPVAPARDSVEIKPNCIFVATPDGDLAISNGQLRVMPIKDPAGVRLPIDYLFRSLAADQRERSVGIVLSGTGTDGTLGLKDIKGAAGMVMVESPASAKYSGMPQSAIATGMVDYVLSPDKMAAQLISYAKGPYASFVEPPPEANIKLPDPMEKILILLRNRTGHDFSVYKPTTILRRIERRMNVHQFQRPAQYIRFLQENQHEFDLLFRELLIGVTSFFRDPEAFDFLFTSALPQLLKSKPETSNVRVWVPGCSSGEEAYSLAILLQEVLASLKLRLHVQIFATDLDNEAIEVAREGRYPAGIAADVSHQRLARFFCKEDGMYKVGKGIREMVIFAPQNLIKDPPFTKLDLISCRNLLIYLKGDTQKRLMSLFHYALVPGGLLFLGSSESISDSERDFVVLQKRWKIFRCKKTAGAYPPPLKPALSPSPPIDMGGSTGPATAAWPRESPLPAMLEKVILKRFVPACVVVNPEGDIQYIQGRTGDYLEPSPGQPRLNILEMARDGLRPLLTSALRRAVVEHKDVIHESVQIQGDHVLPVTIGVSQITDPETLRGLLIVMFRPSPPATARSTKKESPFREHHSGLVKDLERDLQFTRESLQSTVEELQAANEELKSTNEELQSTNEELQSANEELETSKEEMQSLNEELQTVNAELQGKVEALSEAGDDMQNLLESTAVATIFLDGDLKIKRFTEESRKLISLIPSDVGRFVGDLSSNLQYTRLLADARKVLRTLVFKEKEVQTKQGSWRLMRISPYRTTENVIAGVVLTFLDISQVRQAAIYAENIMSTIREPLVILDKSLRVISANRSFYRAFQTTPAAVEKHFFFEIGDGQWRIPKMRHALEEILNKRIALNDFVVEHKFPLIGQKKFVLNARRVHQDSGLPSLILLAMEDITGRDMEKSK